MLPVSYFTPIHKPRRTGSQNLVIGGKRNGHDETISSLNDDEVPEQNEEDEDEDEGGFPDESLQANISSSKPASTRIISVKHAEGSEASRPVIEFHNGFEPQIAESKHSKSKKRLLSRLNELQPPLLSSLQYQSTQAHAGQDTNTSGTRQRHLQVLTAILHRSLLKYDYVRAAKAWSMILRSEMEGHSVDLRNGCRWGIGAEILLQQPDQPPRVSDQIRQVAEVDRNASGGHFQRISSTRFGRLRDYFDRLSLQYPYHKSFPNAVGPLDFRFAMFGLWIWNLTNRKSSRIDQYSSGPGHTAIDGVEEHAEEPPLKEDLQLARELSEQLSELMSSPPFSDSEKFKSLKNMVDCWRADLGVASQVDGPPGPIIPSESSDRASSMEFSISSDAPSSNETQ